MDADRRSPRCVPDLVASGGGRSGARAGAAEGGDLLPRLLHPVLAEGGDAGRDGGRTRSTSTVLETATRSTASSRRPARRAASAIRSRTAARLARTSIAVMRGRYCSGFAAPAPRRSCDGTALVEHRERREASGHPLLPVRENRSRRQAVHRRGFQIVSARTPAATSWSALAVQNRAPSARAVRRPGARPILPRLRERRAQRPDDGLVDLVAAGPDRRADRGMEPLGRAPARSTSAVTSRPAMPRTAAPSRVRHSERRPLGIGDDQRHAVGGEHRQGPRALPRDQRIAGAAEPPGAASSASRQALPWTWRA